MRSHWPPYLLMIAIPWLWLASVLSDEIGWTYGLLGSGMLCGWCALWGYGWGAESARQPNSE